MKLISKEDEEKDKEKETLSLVYAPPSMFYSSLVQTFEDFVL